MKPIDFKGRNSEVAKDQPEYLTLPAWQDSELTISCWQLSWLERWVLLWTGKLWLSQKHWRQSLQPIRPSVDRPEEIP